MNHACVYERICIVFKQLQRVRYSELASHRAYSELQEMVCTMRVWHKTKTPSISSIVKQIEIKETRSFEYSPNRRKPGEHGPELVLTPNQSPVMVHACCSGDFSEPLPMSKRFTSFGSGSLDRWDLSRQRTSAPETKNTLGDVTIPVADIVVVDMFGKGASHQCNLTTMSNGYFELSMENQNGQDILLAFLNANLPKDRLMGSMMRRTNSELSCSTKSTAARSFDVEAFMARRMSERIKSETMSEKLRRKVVRVISSFEESKFFNPVWLERKRCDETFNISFYCLLYIYSVSGINRMRLWMYKR